MKNDRSVIKTIIKNIDEYFKDPNNKQDFLEALEEEMNKPYNTHLQCNEIQCKHNRPDDPDMGTITWCNRYVCNQEKLCDEECGRRSWYDFSLSDPQQDDILSYETQIDRFTNEEEL